MAEYAARDLDDDAEIESGIWQQPRWLHCDGQNQSEGFGLAEIVARR
jgi:hypothetical protein